jgi:hypothetical protein
MVILKLSSNLFFALETNNIIIVVQGLISIDLNSRLLEKSTYLLRAATD